MVRTEDVCEQTQSEVVNANNCKIAKEEDKN